MWVIVFENGNMRIYAKENPENGEPDAIPAFGNDRQGYLDLPLRELAPDSDQFEVVAQQGNRTYWRIIPDTFLSDTRITEGTQNAVAPMDVHKYTVVMYLEGDDVHATDELIGGSLGLEMNFRLADEEVKEEGGLKSFFDKVFKNLEFK